MEPLSQPILVAGSYVLRPFTATDAQLVKDASTDRLIPLITTVPSSIDDAEALAFIERRHRRLEERSGYSFAIADSRTNEAVGQIGLWLKNLDQGRASVGYWIVADRRRQGIATAALLAVSNWALDIPDLSRLDLYVEPWNEGSMRTAANVGYVRQELLRGWHKVGDEYKDMYLYTLRDSPIAHQQ